MTKRGLRTRPGKRRPRKVDSDGMNATERAYARRLNRDETVESWEFEPIRLRLGRATIDKPGTVPPWYTPDFVVVRTDGTIEVHEVKGHFEEAAKLRIKIAADRHPFRFVLAQAKEAGGRTKFELCTVGEG